MVWFLVMLAYLWLASNIHPRITLLYPISGSLVANYAVTTDTKLSRWLTVSAAWTGAGPAAHSPFELNEDNHFFKPMKEYTLPVCTGKGKCMLSQTDRALRPRALDGLRVNA